MDFTVALRGRTEQLAATMHRLYNAHETTPALPGKHCDRCSLIDVCLPQGTARAQVAVRWQAAQQRHLLLDPID